MKKIFLIFGFFVESILSVNAQINFFPFQHQTTPNNNVIHNIFYPGPITNFYPNCNFYGCSNNSPYNSFNSYNNYGNFANYRQNGRTSSMSISTSATTIRTPQYNNNNNNYNNNNNNDNNNNDENNIINHRRNRIFTSPRISEKMCAEYSSITEQNFHAGGLILDASDKTITTKDCDTSQGLIVGGQDTAPGEFPHMAAIGYKIDKNNLAFRCGGSLISNRFVITAGHCKFLDYIEASVVRLGVYDISGTSHNQQQFSIDEFNLHKNYNNDLKHHDIALIKLNKIVEFSKYIRPACLMTSNNFNTDKVIATGWGLTKPITEDYARVLQKVKLNILDEHECNRINNLSGYHVGPTQICTGGSIGRFF